MQPAHPARLLRIHISEADRYRGKPLYEAIVDKCRDLKVAGATVFRGLEGYGETAEIHKAHVIHHDRPILISVIDTADSLTRLIPVLEEMIDTGLMAVSEVKVVRVQKKEPALYGKHDGSSDQ
jgi:PII-like signaling protein